MSLAVAEKRPQRRTGGCARIFFQFLDWNRKLAKKKLFSKKLLPPVRSLKRQTKKLYSDDKIPRAKLMLIDDENRGGFPSYKKMAEGDETPGNGMRAPGIVARLMGLDSIPVGDHEKPRRALDSECCSYHDKSGEYSRLDQGLCQEVPGQGKLDPRPLKLQKTEGFLEQRSANAAKLASSDAIHKSVLARSRKQQHKLASPVKTPRLFSSGNQALLMQAATKILEPGLRTRSRSRLALTCNGISDSKSVGSESSVELIRSNELQNELLIGSCRSCGGTVEFSHNVYATLGSSNVSFQNRDVENSKVHDGKTSAAAVQTKSDTNGKDRNSLERQCLASDHVKTKSPQQMNPKVASKTRILRRGELPMIRDNVAHGSKLCSRRRIDNDANEFVGSKHFVGAKKNLNSSPRFKSAVKMSSSNGANAGGRVWEKSVVYKGGSGSNSKADNGTASNPNFIKSRRSQASVGNKKESVLNFGQAINRNHVKNVPKKRVNVESLSSRDPGIVSFTFSSPMKHNFQSFAKEATSGKRQDTFGQAEFSFQPKVSVVNANENIILSPSGKNSLRGDELSNLLEEEIREMNSFEQAEAGNWDTSGRTTASILKELISAITANESISQIINKETESEISTPKESIIDSFALLSLETANGNQNFYINQKFQTGSNSFNATSVVSDNDHPSPISIFDASFSSETCSVGSFNGSFDMKDISRLRIDFTDKCNRTESLNPVDSDLLDSATSLFYNRKILNLCGRDSSMHTIHSYEGISKLKFLIESILFYDSDNTLRHTSVHSFLSDMLTSISNAFFGSMKSCLSSSESNDYNILLDYIIDYLNESLDSRFNNFCLSGYNKMWGKLPMLSSKKHLSDDIYAELGRLVELAGKRLDDLAEQELSSSAIRWTMCQAEASLTGINVERGILKDLIDEMVWDLCNANKLSQ